MSMCRSPSIGIEPPRDDKDACPLLPNGEAPELSRGEKTLPNSSEAADANVTPPRKLFRDHMPPHGGQGADKNPGTPDTGDEECEEVFPPQAAIVEQTMCIMQLLRQEMAQRERCVVKVLQEQGRQVEEAVDRYLVSGKKAPSTLAPPRRGLMEEKLAVTPRLPLVTTQLPRGLQNGVDKQSKCGEQHSIQNREGGPKYASSRSDESIVSQRSDKNVMLSATAAEQPTAVGLVCGKTSTTNSKRAASAVSANSPTNDYDKRQTGYYMKSSTELIKLKATLDDAMDDKTIRDDDPCLVKLEKHPAFGYIMSGVIALNGLTIGAQVNYEALYGESSTWYAVEAAFSAIFVFELAVRLYSQRSQFLYNPKHRSWNIFDATLVALAIVEQFSLISIGKTEMLEYMNYFASLKLLRLLRLIRVVNFLAELRLMVDIIIVSFKSLLWCFVLIMMQMLVFGIVFTSGTTMYRNGPEHEKLTAEQVLHLDKHYGSLLRTIYTLFLAVTGGIDWSEASTAIQHTGLIYFMMFLGYIFLMIFSVLNIVTGVFVDGAIEHARQNRNAIMNRMQTARSNHMKEMMSLLQTIDADGSGFITWAEFRDSLQDEAQIKFWETLNVNMSEAADIFQVLDENGDGNVDILEFVEMMRRLEGGAKNSDMQLVKVWCKRLHNILSDLEEGILEAQGVRVPHPPDLGQAGAVAMDRMPCRTDRQLQRQMTRMQAP
eukprot:TRINITY_DN23696_c0_g2_i1.p1 TRINITY_DN23696_c0_g2~~TRINITY_DN23696_c0_g2_i1.p1  ORF type:complete len:764 (-),score=184.87 TRINITY_DN23696_c0_g2_i1:66-2210(-)